MKNILIVDSGSTSADWAQIDGIRAPKTVKTPGINPYFHSEKEIRDIIQLEVLPFINHELVENVYFYGAGLMSAQNVEIIENMLGEVFGLSSMEVESDILGAARSLFGDRKGIACILGTGSNSCLYDGDKIENNIFSGGYILGDEGGGAHLGKIILRHYVRKELPKELHEKFESKYRERRDEIIYRINREQRPNKFMASFAEFINENQEHEFIRNIVKYCFGEFFNNHICKYTDYKHLPVRFTGSVSFHFKDILHEVSEAKGLKISKIEQEPIEGLIKFHKERAG